MTNSFGFSFWLIKLGTIVLLVVAITAHEDCLTLRRTGSSGIALIPSAFRDEGGDPGQWCFDHIIAGTCGGSLQCEAIEITYANTLHCEFLDARPSSAGMDQCSEYTSNGEPNGTPCMGESNVFNTNTDCLKLPCFPY